MSDISVQEDLIDKVNSATEFSDYDLVVFIENEEDKRFWNYIFKKASIDKKIDFNAYSKSGSQGKVEVLKYADFLGEHSGKALICVDSDFDYITNHPLTINPYIFQTYTYSVESYICCAKSLNHILKESLLIDNFDFEIFLRKYSTIIFELLLLDVFLKNEMTDIDYKSNVDKNTLANNGELFLEQLKLKTQNKIAELHTKFSISTTERDNIKSKIINDTLLKDDFVHLYINGHRIFELIQEILEKLQNESLEIQIDDCKRRLSGQQLGDKIKELKSNRLDIGTLLKSRFDNCYYEGYCSSFQYIVDEVKRVL